MAVARLVLLQAATLALLSASQDELVDHDQNCPQWAAEGLCESEPDRMRNCLHSCPQLAAAVPLEQPPVEAAAGDEVCGPDGVCGPGGAAADAPAEEVTPPVETPPPTMAEGYVPPAPPMPPPLSTTHTFEEQIPTTTASPPSPSPPPPSSFQAAPAPTEVKIGTTDASCFTPLLDKRVVLALHRVLSSLGAGTLALLGESSDSGRQGAATLLGVPAPLGLILGTFTVFMLALVFFRSLPTPSVTPASGAADMSVVTKQIEALQRNVAQLSADLQRTHKETVQHFAQIHRARQDRQLLDEEIILTLKDLLDIAAGEYDPDRNNNGNVVGAHPPHNSVNTLRPAPAPLSASLLGAPAQPAPAKAPAMQPVQPAPVGQPAPAPAPKAFVPAPVNTSAPAPVTTPLGVKAPGPAPSTSEPAAAPAPAPKPTTPEPVPNPFAAAPATTPLGVQAPGPAPSTSETAAAPAPAPRLTTPEPNPFAAAPATPLGVQAPGPAPSTSEPAAAPAPAPRLTTPEPVPNPFATASATTPLGVQAPGPLTPEPAAAPAPAPRLTTPELVPAEPVPVPGHAITSMPTTPEPVKSPFGLLANRQTTPEPVQAPLQGAEDKMKEDAEAGGLKTNGSQAPEAEKATGNPFARVPPKASNRPPQQTITANANPFGRPQPKAIQASGNPFGARPQPKEIVATKGPFGGMQ